MAGSSDDCFLAFAGIRFRNNTPVTFVPAKTVYDLEHKRRPPFRYVVEDCRTGFMDAMFFTLSVPFPDMPVPIICWILMIQKMKYSDVLSETPRTEN